MGERLPVGTNVVKRDLTTVVVYPTIHMEQECGVLHLSGSL
jgi:hypothetical protein